MKGLVFDASALLAVIFDERRAGAWGLLALPATDRPLSCRNDAHPSSRTHAPLDLTNRAVTVLVDPSVRPPLSQDIN